MGNNDKDPYLGAGTPLRTKLWWKTHVRKLEDRMERQEGIYI
jgi:hypothetical protein